MIHLKKLRARIATLATRTGPAQPGFFVRYDYADTVDGRVPSYPDVEMLFASCQPDLLKTVSDFSTYLPDLWRAVDKELIPWEEQGWFPVLDVVAAYHMVRSVRPKQIIEIGSGASTHVLSQALSDNDSGELLCIDPSPRRSVLDTGAKIELRILSIEDVKLAEGLEANDILFIDSSHLMLPGMDVDIQFNRMFPKLRSGTLVHVHDIYLPDSYPADWEHRFYSEQNALIAWILSGFFEVIYPSYHVATRLEAALGVVLGERMPAYPKKNAGSIWLRRS
jgi:hypothetical protein